MKLLKASGLLLLVLGLMPFATAQATYYDRDSFCEKLQKYYPKYYAKYCKKDPKPECDYDLREGSVYFNANNRPSDGSNNPTQNELIVFLRDKDTGLLSVPPANKYFDTHRVKSGGFGNQAGIVTSGQWSVIHTGEGDEQYVFMINAGFDVTNKKSDRNGSVSVFKINKCEAKLTDVKSTYGQEPRSVDRDTSYHASWKSWYKSNRDLVTVVNAGSGEVQFNGCPGLPVGFLAPTGLTCGERPPVDKFDSTSIVVYKFDAKYGKLYKVDFARTEDEDGDPAQSAFVNEGRQVIVSQRNTFFALGDGKEDDIVEVFNLDKWGKIVSGPHISKTTGNDNFGFSVYEPGPKNSSCVMMSHGSFQQRDQGGVSVFQVDASSGFTIDNIPNKADGGSDTCWTAISNRTNTLYTSAFFDSELSIRSIVVQDDGEGGKCCNLTDGGPPVIVVDGVPQFGPNPDAPEFGLNWNNRHRVSSHPNRDADGGALATDQSDFLAEAGGLDIATSQSKKGGEFLYALNAPVPFASTRDGDGNFCFPGDACDVTGLGPTSSIAIYKIVEDCGASNPTIFNVCRPGDLIFVGRVTGLQASGFGMAAY